MEIHPAQLKRWISVVLEIPSNGDFYALASAFEAGMVSRVTCGCCGIHSYTRVMCVNDPSFGKIPTSEK